MPFERASTILGFLATPFFLLFFHPFESVPNTGDAPSETHAPLRYDTGSESVAPPAAIPMRPGMPVRIRIPKIGVDTAVERVGILPDGRMGSPKKFSNAAWFDRWPRPGEMGSSVIDGHFGWIGKTPWAFDRIRELREGDTFSLQDENGKITVFSVRKIRKYWPDADASGVFSSNDGKSHVNLITCEGVWNGKSKAYPYRLVIFSDELP